MICQAPLFTGFPRQNIGVGCHLLLQGIFSTQRLNPHLLPWQAGSLPLSHQGMEKAMAPHSSTLAWKIPWTEERGRLQSMGSLGVGHDWVTSLSLFTLMDWRRKWQCSCHFLKELQCSCLENPREGGAWWAAVYGVTQTRTRLKRLSSSSIKEALMLSHRIALVTIYSRTLLKVTWNNFEQYLYPGFQRRSKCLFATRGR